METLFAIAVTLWIMYKILSNNDDKHTDDKNTIEESNKLFNEGGISRSMGTDLENFNHVIKFLNENNITFDLFDGEKNKNSIIFIPFDVDKSNDRLHFAVFLDDGKLQVSVMIAHFEMKEKRIELFEILNKFNRDFHFWSFYIDYVQGKVWASYTSSLSENFDVQKFLMVPVFGLVAIMESDDMKPLKQLQWR